MEDMRKEQLEVLQDAVEYIAKLVPVFKTIVEELKTEKKEDTIEYMNMAIEGLNYVIEVFNVTYPLLNEKEELFQKDVIEEKVQALNKAIGDKDDIKTAEAIEDGMIPFLEIFAQIAKLFLQKEAE